jgi:hypothetical protein
LELRALEAQPHNQKKAIKRLVSYAYCPTNDFLAKHEKLRFQQLCQQEESKRKQKKNKTRLHENYPDEG